MDSKIRRRKITVLPSGNWISQARFAEFRRKSRHAIANSDLYHYAGNNPVKYTDPDGEIDLPFFSLGDFFGFLSQITSGSDRITATAVAAANRNEASKSRLKTLSPYMCEAMSKVSGEAVVGGMRFMAENGTTLALVAYASGQVEVGTVIDGITVACDITLAYEETKNTGNYKDFAKVVTTDLMSTAIGYGVSSKLAKVYTSNFNNLPDSITAKAIDSVSNMLGEYAGSAAETSYESVYVELAN